MNRDIVGSARGARRDLDGVALAGHPVRAHHGEDRRQDDLTRLRRNMVDVLGHEMRTPLTVILGFADLLLDGLDGALSEGQRQAVAAMRDAALREVQLLEDVLVLARTRSDSSWLRADRVDLCHVVRTTVENLRQAVRDKGLQLHTDIGEGVWVMADAPQLRRALDHLVGNALKFTPRGSIAVSCHAVDGEGVVEVRDTGIGMAPEDMEHAFEEFRQADQGTTRRYAGAGIGLAVVRALVEAHGGRVEVASEVGAGSRFTARLPLAPPP